MALLSKNKLLILFGLLTISIAPYFYISQFAHPIGDDFSYTFEYLKRGLLTRLKYDYFHWNGRYFSNILLYQNPLVWKSFFIYRLIPIFLILETIDALFCLLKVLFAEIKNRILLLLSIVFTLLYLHQMPTLVEGYYWFTGAITYQLAIILSLYYLCFFIRILEQKFFVNKVIDISIATLLLLIVIGFNEVNMLIVLVFHGIVFFINYQKTKVINSQLVFFLVASLAFASIMIFAPGNQGRESYFDPTTLHNFEISIKGTIFQSIQFFGWWFIDIALPIATLLYLIILPDIKENKWIKNSFHLKPWQSFFLIPTLLTICIFPCYWNTGMIGQHRTMNVAYFFFILIWFINLTVFANYFKNNTILQKIQTLKKYFFILSLIMVASMMLLKNGYAVNKDIITKKINHFDAEMNSRYDLLEKAKQKNLDYCYLPAIQNTDCTLFIWDIKDKPKHWLNRGYGQYFRIKNVYLIPEK